MTLLRKLILLLLLSGMALICIYQWGLFLFSFIPKPPLVFSELSAELLLSLIVVYSARRKGFRRIYKIMAYFTGYIISVIFIFNRDFNQFDSFADFSLFPDKTFEGVIFTVLIYFFAGLIWFLASNLLTKPLNTKRVSHFFDLGIAGFLVIVLTQLAIVFKGGRLSFNDNTFTESLIVYLLLGLFSLGFVRLKRRSWHSLSGAFKTGFVILIYFFSTVLTAYTLLYFFSPELKYLTETGSDLIRNAVSPVESGLIIFLRFFMDNSFRKSTFLGIKSGSAPTVAINGNIGGGIDEIIVYGTAFLLFACAAFFAVMLLLYSVFRIWRWLSFKNGGDRKEKGYNGILIKLILFLMHIFSVARRKKGGGSLTRCYRHLLRWGRMAGFARLVSETPSEYAFRIGKRFPGIKENVDFIVTLYNEYIYGGIDPGAEQVETAVNYIKKIHNPLILMKKIK